MVLGVGRKVWVAGFAVVSEGWAVFAEWEGIEPRMERHEFHECSRILRSQFVAIGEIRVCLILNPCASVFIRGFNRWVCLGAR